MTTSISTTFPNDEEFSKMSDAELLAEIRRRLTVSAESLVSLASAVGPAIRRDLDLSFINPLLIDVLRKIEQRQISPTFAERFMYLHFFGRIKNLPLEDQEKLAQSGKIEVAVRRGDNFDVRKMDIEALTKAQAKLAFTQGRLRSTSEMIAILEDESVEQSDPFDESLVSLKIAAEIDLTKSQRKTLLELADKKGSMSALLKQLLLSRIAK